MPEPTNIPAAPRPSRRWFRVSLRGLMVLVLIVGGVAGWLAHRARVQREAVALIRAAGGSVRYDFQFSTDPAELRRVRGIPEPAAPRWLRRWVGDDFFQTAAAVDCRGKVTPEVLAAIGRLDGLVALTLRRPTGQAGAWATLAGLTHLETVNLSGVGVTDAAIAVLGKLGSLQTIHLGWVGATDAGIEPLARLPRLRDLTIVGCRGLTDAGVARLLAAGPPELEGFAWMQAAEGSYPQTIRALAEHHPGLKRLGLVQNEIADADLAPISKLTSLTALNLQQTRVTDAGLVHLEPLVRLERLWANLPFVTSAGMRSVGKLRSLQFLDLDWTGVGDAGLAELTGLSQLRQLNLTESPLTDAGLVSLGRLPALEQVNLNRTEITDAGLPALESLRALKGLGLSATNVTPAGLTRLRAALPGCTVFTAGSGGTGGPPPIPPPPTAP